MLRLLAATGCLVLLLGGTLPCRAGEVQIGADYAQDFFRDVSGGVERGGGAPGTVHLHADGNVGNDIFRVDLLGIFGSSISDNAGDLQTLSNLEAYHTARLFEAWYEHDFDEAGLGFRLGLQDYNLLFDTLEPAQLFINSSFGIEPTVSQVSVSIFPETALGAVMRWRSPQHAYVLAGVYDGTPGLPGHPAGTHIELRSGDGLFSAFEAGINDAGKYKLAAGYWYHTAMLDYPPGRHWRHNHGWYLIGSAHLLGGKSVPAVSAFVQLGRALTDRNPFSGYLGAGISFNRFLPGRPDDRLGFAVARVRTSRTFRRITHASTGSETAFELTYQANLTNGLYLQPDVQYIVNPGAVATVDNAWMAGLRVGYSF